MPELRKDMITGGLVIIATERSKRPQDFLPGKEPPKGSGGCVFCYGNETRTPPEVFAVRPGGGPPDSPGWTIRAFPNKFPAVSADGNPGPVSQGDEKVFNAVGLHEVVVDTPDHFETFGKLADNRAELVMEAIASRYRHLTGDPRVKYIQVFKNSGAAAGASLEHSHWQIITVPMVPESAARELNETRKFWLANGECPYCRLISDEIRDGSRIIDTNGDFIVLTPFASRFPYEIWIVPAKHEPCFEKTGTDKIKSLGRIVRSSIRKLERTLTNPPYNMVISSCPPGAECSSYHWHIKILPRITTIAGFELGSGIHINPVSPEAAAELLREADPDLCDNTGMNGVEAND